MMIYKTLQNWTSRTSCISWLNTVALTENFLEDWKKENNNMEDLDFNIYDLQL